VPVLSYSSVGFLDRDVEAALDGIAAAGFTHSEIVGQSPHVNEPLVGEALRGFRERMAGRGLNPSTVHAPLTYNVLGAPDETWRLEKVEVLSGYLRFTGELGANGMVIHPIPNPKFVPNPEDLSLPAKMVTATRRSLDALVPVAEKAGVCMLLENLPYDCHYPLLTLRELREVVDDYPPEQVGLVIDTGHAWTLKIDPVSEIRAAGERLRGTHLQDVPGEDPNDNHWVPTHGDLDWDAIRAALVEVGYQGAWTFEVAIGRHGESQEELARLSREVARDWGL